MPQPFGGDMTLYSATQIPHILKIIVAVLTGIPEHQMRVVAPSVGGGFGSKLNVYAEELLCTALARKHGVPVRWTEERSEASMSTIQGRGQIQDIELAADEHGKLTAIRVRLIGDMGALPPAGRARRAAARRVPLRRRVRAAEGVRLLVHLGVHEHDADRRLPRRRAGPRPRTRSSGRWTRSRRRWASTRSSCGAATSSRKEQFPYEAFTGLTYDSGDHDAAATMAAELMDYDGFRARQAAQNVPGATKLLGLGVSTYFEMCGLAPSRVLASLNYGAGGWEAATVRVLPTNRVQVVTGTAPHGQGHETSWSMIAAEKLGVDPADVDVLHSDTAIAPYGLDTYGSRSLPVGGVAIANACDGVIDKARQIAAHQLEANADDLEFSGGVFRVAGSPDKEMPLAAVAFAAFTAHNLPDGMEPNLEHHTTTTRPTSRGRSARTCASSRSTSRPARSTCCKYVAVDDCGVQVNPLIVDGQVHGGVIQGLAQALYEEAVYDTDGNLKTSTLAEYLVPAASDVPSITLGHTVTPSPTNPLGVKGIGEAGTIGAAPAVINAVVDALSGLGVHDVPMPASPNNVWDAIQAARTSNQQQHPWRLAVIPAAFDYVRAGSAEEAISLIGEHGDEAKFLAGGHSLLPLMKLRLAQPSVLVDIGRVTDLSYIRDAGDHVAIGALTRHMDVETSALLEEHVPLLAHAASHVGDPQVRHRGTIGGSIAHADPASDLPATTLALGATYVAQGPNGTREIAAADFYQGFLTSSLDGRRDAHRDPRPEDERRRLELPEVQPPRPGLGDRRRRRLAPQRRLGRGAGEHGLDPDPRHERVGGARRRGLDRGRRRSRPPPRPSRRPTSTPASSTAPTSPRCW